MSAGSRMPAAFPFAPPDVDLEQLERRCRVCGCTDLEACVEVLGDGMEIACVWVEVDLCSACEGGDEEA